MEGARRAREEDRPICRALLAGALTDAGTMRGGPALVGPLDPDDLVARWTETSAPSALFVGEFQQVVVGVAAVTVFTRPGAAHPSGRIECCYVESAARGVGVGTALMEALVAWCGDHGCRDIDALALPGDRSSKQRLEAAGFTARLLTLNRSLD